MYYERKSIKYISCPWILTTLRDNNFKQLIVWTVYMAEKKVCMFWLFLIILIIDFVFIVWSD